MTGGPTPSGMGRKGNGEGGTSDASSSTYLPVVGYVSR